MSYKDYIDKVVAWELDDNASECDKAVHVARRIAIIDYSLLILQENIADPFRFQIEFVNIAGVAEENLRVNLTAGKKYGALRLIASCASSYKPKGKTKASYLNLFKADPLWTKIEELITMLEQIA